MSENTFYGLPFVEGKVRVASVDRVPEYRDMTPMYEDMAKHEREYVEKLKTILDLPWEEWKKQWESRIASGEVTRLRTK